MHPVTKGGAKQIPGRQGARCRRHSPARPPRPALRELRTLCERGPDVGWGRRVGAPDPEGRFPVWGVETPRPTQPTCSGGPLPLSQKRRCTRGRSWPAPTQRLPHPGSLSRCWSSARPAHLGPGGRAGGTGDRASLGKILSVPPSQL